MAEQAIGKSRRVGVTAKLALAFSALLMGCAALGVYALSRLGEVEDAARDLDGHWLQTTRALGDIAYLGQRFRVIEAAVVLAPPEGKAAEQKTLAAIRADVEAAFARQAQKLASPEERRELDASKSAWTDYLSLDDRFLAAGAEDAARLYRTQMRDSIHTFQDAVKAAIKRNVAGADAAGLASEASGEAGKRGLVAGFALLALVCIAIGWRLQASIVRPVRALTFAMTRLAEGALDVESPGLERADEIGDMARASTVFRDAGRRRRADLEAEAETQRQAAQQARDAAEVTREHASRTQREAMQALGAALGALAEGDMQRRLDAEFPPEFGDLRDDYERARETLGSALSAVVAASTALAQEHRALDRSAEELSSRTERQAANLEQSAAALQEITTAVKTSSESASEARAAVNSAKTQAERGADVAAEAISAMDGLAQSAKEIREITSLIDEIAFQTSLLALNAGVEAARAGDAGKGFAVVAMEVRALAGRSADMAQRISELISASNRQVEVGVAKVGATGEALGRIAQEVGRLNGIVEDIARGATDQARSLVEVNAAIREMDQTTQNNAALAEESHATTRRFAEEIAALDARLRPFRLDPAMQEREAA